MYVWDFLNTPIPVTDVNFLNVSINCEISINPMQII